MLGTMSGGCARRHYRTPPLPPPHPSFRFQSLCFPPTAQQPFLPGKGLFLFFSSSNLSVLYLVSPRSRLGCLLQWLLNIHFCTHSTLSSPLTPHSLQPTPFSPSLVLNPSSRTYVPLSLVYFLLRSFISFPLCSFLLVIRTFGFRPGPSSRPRPLSDSQWASPPTPTPSSRLIDRAP